MTELILNSDLVVVARVIDLFEVPQVSPIASVDDWDAVVGGEMHGVGQDVEVAILKIGDAVVAPSEVETMAMIGRLTPADRSSKVEEGQQLLLFFERATFQSVLSPGTHDAIQYAASCDEVWKVKSEAVWELDKQGRLSIDQDLCHELVTEDELVPVATVVDVIHAHALASLPRGEITWGSGPFGPDWSAALYRSGSMHEFKEHPSQLSDLTPPAPNSGSAHWNTGDSSTAFENILAAAGRTHSHTIGGRGLHNPAVNLNLRTMRGRFRICMSTPFHDYSDPNSEDHMLVAACMEFLRALQLKKLPVAAADALLP